MNVVIEATDGFRLAASRFVPQAPNGDAVVLASATGVKRKFYEPFAAHLSEHGFDVTTFDYRGIGDSAGPSKQFAASMSDWGVKDLTAVLGSVRSSVQPGRLLLVGHSVGGQVLGLASGIEKLDRVLLVARRPATGASGTGSERRGCSPCGPSGFRC